MKNELIAKGRVERLCLDGRECEKIAFDFDGPIGDSHRSRTRFLSDHDGAYVKTSSLVKKMSAVLNWRSWTALSIEELKEIEDVLGCTIPIGCLLENIIVSGIPHFSKLAPTSRLVFPNKNSSQAVLAVWEENGPCHIAGQRLEDYHQVPGLKTELIAAAQNRRGVMGLVLAEGWVEVDDEVLVYPPAE